MYEKFFKDLAIKTIKTFFQSLAGAMTTAVLISDVDWKYALGASCLAAVYCIAFNVGSGLPEANTEDTKSTEEETKNEEQEG